MMKIFGFIVFAFFCSVIGKAGDVKVPAASVQQSVANVPPAVVTVQSVATPKNVVKTALDAVKGVINSKQERGQELTRMKNFSSCFLHPAVKQKAMMTLILGGMKNYTIVKETLSQSAAKVEVDVQFDKEKTRVFFDLVYRKKAWWITRIN